MKPFIAFVQKEFHHILRDTRTTLILVVMPVILIIIFGYAITTEIQRVPIAVLDNSHNELTQKMVNRLQVSEYFDLYASVSNPKEVEKLFRQGKIVLAVLFPPNYIVEKETQLQILADATDPNQATQLTHYASAILSEQLSAEKHRLASSRQCTEMDSASYNTTPLFPGEGIHPIPHLLYNPQMKGSYNFVPGVMGLILILICAMMTSVGIVREKETGTMEVLLVSPLKPIYIILAKAIPYLLISLVNIATILFLSYYLLEVPIRGSLFLLVAVSILYAIVSLCLGLLISTVVETQQAAMLVSGVVLMLPVILLSGMMFPIENMPDILQYLSHVVPAKWYISAARDIMIKGLPLSAILPETSILSGMAIGLILLSVKRFKIRL